MLLPGPAQPNLDTSHRSAEAGDFAVLWFRWKCVILWPEDDERDVFVPPSQFAVSTVSTLSTLSNSIYVECSPHLRILDPDTLGGRGSRCAVAAARGNPLSEREERMSVVTIKLSTSQVTTDTAESFNTLSGYYTYTSCRLNLNLNWHDMEIIWTTNCEILHMQSLI